MSDPKMTAIEKIKNILVGWSFHVGFPTDDGLAALAVLEVLAEENAALKKEVERLAKDNQLLESVHKHDIKEFAYRKTQLETAEAELNEAQDEAGRLKVAHRQMYAVAQEQVDLARKAEAELDAARPLLNEAMKAEQSPFHSSAPLLRAALAYRASKEGK